MYSPTCICNDCKLIRGEKINFLKADGNPYERKLNVNPGFSMSFHGEDDGRGSTADRF